jgi:hypothetical protein
MTSEIVPPRFRLGFLTHVRGRGDLATTYRNGRELFVVALATLRAALSNQEGGTPGFRIQPPARDFGGVATPELAVA